MGRCCVAVPSIGALCDSFGLLGVKVARLGGDLVLSIEDVDEALGIV